MRTSLAVALVASLALAGPVVAFAGQASKTASHATAEKTTTGTVKSMDDKTLVLKTKGGDRKFTLDPAAKKDGVTTGAHVKVHYKTEGKSMVATSVMIEAAPAAKK